MKKLLLSVCVFSVLATTLVGQSFMTPLYTASGKKPSYLTLTSGEEVAVLIKKFKLEKGLIEEMKVESVSGEKVKIKPEEITHMYVMPRSLEKMFDDIEFIQYARRWNDEKINDEKIQEGYMYYERVEVELKKGKRETLMMMLLNPNFSSHLKVYNDPKAKETASIGVGPLQAGGHAKSYYIKKADETIARKYMKKDFKEGYDELFKECRSMKNPEDKDWSELPADVFKYTQCIADSK